MDKFWETIITVTSGIVGLAIVAVLVSRKSQTPAVIQSAASGFANSLGVAASPVTGLGYNINTSYPGSGGFAGLPSFNGGFGIGQ